MRVLMIVPRFHSNLLGIDSALFKAGCSVLIIAQTKGPSEFAAFGTVKITPRADQTLDLATTTILSFQPDLMIHRSVSARTDPFWEAATALKIPSISYDQGPVWLGMSSFIFQPFVSIRFLVSHWLRTVRIKKYARLSPVKKWGVGLATKMSRSFFLPIPVSPPPFALPSGREGRSASAPEVICIAKHGQKRKRVRWLLRAQTRSRIRFRLTVVGSAPINSKNWKNYEGLLRVAKRNQARGHEVEILSDLERKDVFEIMHRSNLFVLPSRSEPFSVSVLEAMHVGVPVLVANTGGAASYVSPGRNGDKFLVWSYWSFASRLSKLLANPKQLADMGRNARSQTLSSNADAALLQTIASIVAGYRFK